MLRIAGQRLLQLIATVLVASSADFLLIHLSGDPVAGFLPPGTSPAEKAATRHALGLDRPIAVQYLDTMGRALTGQFADSWRSQQPALDVVMARLPATLLLAVSAVVVASLLGGAAGIAGARFYKSWLDRALLYLEIGAQAVPAFWLGTLLILLFAVRLSVLPSSGSGGVRGLVLPVLTLAAYPAAIIARLLRAELLALANQSFLRTAEAKGLSAWVVLLRHALPNALLPTLAYIGLQLSFLFGGAIIVESVFAYPGIGRLALQAATDRDIPVIQAFVVIVALLVSLANLAVDLVALAIDPRLRSSSGMVAHGR
jgi:peptide/nickel transport system permease protein